MSEYIQTLKNLEEKSRRDHDPKQEKIFHDLILLEEERRTNREKR